MLDKFAAVQMIDVHIPTTDGRELLLTRYTEPEKDFPPFCKHFFYPPNHVELIFIHTIIFKRTYRASA